MKNLKPLSRRDFLKLSTAVSLALLLSACSPAPTPTPTPTAMPTLTHTPLPTATLLPTATPTAAPTATLTPTPKPTIPLTGLQGVPYPEESLIRAGLEKFGLTSQGSGAGNLIYEQRPNLNDPNKTQIVFARDPATKEVVLATRMNPQTKELEWHVAGLRDLADAVGIRTGTNLSTPYFSTSTIALHDALVVQEFNHAIIDNITWHQTEQNQGIFTFDRADRATLLAINNNMTAEGDDLVYGGSNFQFTFLKDFKQQAQKEGLTPEQMKVRLIEMMKSHIKELVGRYKGKITQWSVVNEYEPTDYDQFNMIIGPEYVDIAFAAAREADPGAVLYINHGFESRGDYNYGVTKPIVDRLKAKGLIDAVGLQMQMNATQPPDHKELIATMKSFGLPIIISSVTINMQGVPGTDAERYKLQAQILKDVFGAAIESGVCRDFYFWEGFGDKDNWLERMDISWGGPKADATIFDDNYQPKPAYFAFYQALLSFLDH